MTHGRAAGLVLAVLSAAAFSTSGSLAGSLIVTGWTPGAAVVARLLVAAVVLTIPAALALRGRWSLLRAGAGTIALYGVVAVAGAQFAYFNAVSHLSVGVALLLEYQGAVLVVAWLWLRHGRRPRPLVLAGSVVALGGLALVLDVLGGVRLDGVGVLWGLIAAVGLATFFVMSGDDTQPLPPLVVSCASLWVGAVVLLAAGFAGLVPLRTATAPVVLAGALGTARVRCATADLPLLLLDLAVPRNVDPALARAPGVTVVDIDALRPAVAAGERERSAAVPQAERIVEEELAEFSDWTREAAAREAIRPLHRALEQVCRREVAFALRGAARARGAAETDAERAARRVVAKLLAGPMAELRAAAARGESVDALAASLARLFPADAAPAPVAVPPADALPGVRAELRPPYAAPRGLAC